MAAVDIQLFLAHADDHQPLLTEGIPWRAALETPVPRVTVDEPVRYDSAAPADDLSEQGWGVLAPKGPAGDRLLDLIEPLRRRREQEQGAEAVIYRLDPGMDPGAAAAWIREDYWNAVRRRAEALPRYLLIVGDPDLVSWDLQQLLGAEAFIGRLAFPKDGDYESYVEKVLRWERQQPLQAARTLFYAVQDGTRSTVTGYEQLIRPSIEIARDRRVKGKFPAGDIVEIGGDGQMLSGEGLLAHAHEMLRQAESCSGNVLLSMSHGAGAPRAGWGSIEEQHACQGAMVVSRTGDRLIATDIQSRPFLPGGVWFFFACYSAGTPAYSAYHPWLDRLHRAGWGSSADRVLAALPRPGEPPFVAALPCAALANPNGPLGVIGHVDLAWTWAFIDYEFSRGAMNVRSRAERFQGILRAFVQGHRLGVAHHELTRFFRSVSMELSTLYGEDTRLGAEAGDEDLARMARRAGLWMQRQDLGAYVLLGDPAARLPIAQYPAGVKPPEFFVSPGMRQPPVGSTGVAPIEAAVLDVLRRAEPPGAIAARYGLHEAELDRAVTAFIEAGRAALARGGR
jgi:hypothetical protein